MFLVIFEFNFYFHIFNILFQVLIFFKFLNQYYYNDLISILHSIPFLRFFLMFFLDHFIHSYLKLKNFLNLSEIFKTID